MFGLFTINTGCVFKIVFAISFKLKKNDLRNEAFNIDKVPDQIYCLKPNSSNYEVLDNEWLQTINSEQAGY